MARSLNKVQLIGNVVKDPELRYTQTGTGICAFTIATDRAWVVNGEKKEESEFHRVVAWSKLAELCSKLLKKGTKTYVSGRISNRSYEKDGEKRYVTEIIMEDMIVLSQKTGDAVDNDSIDSAKGKPTEDIDSSDIPV